jgi:hypothetical protein
MSSRSGKRIIVFFASLVLALTGSCAEPAPAKVVGLKNDAGIWWFTSPDGQPFLSIGVNHVEPVYWRAQGDGQFAVKTYGPDFLLQDGGINDGSPSAKVWADRVAANLTGWGFNTLGMHTPPLNCLHSFENICFVVELKIPVSWGWNMKRQQMHQAFKRNPVDVFSDEFAATVEANAKEVVGAYANNPRVLGYVYTDGPPWALDTDKATEKSMSAAEKAIHPWVLALMNRPATAKGKQAWIALLQQRYASSGDAGRTYDLTASSWNDLAAKTGWSAVADSVKAGEDSRAFLHNIIRQWYSVRKDAIRRYDPNHLIIGDKLNVNRDARDMEEMSAVLRIMKDYVDLTCMQYYAPFAEQKPVLARIYAETQKPILNGDTTYLRNDERKKSDEFYTAMGETYSRELAALFALPYYVGFHHCGYIRGFNLPYQNAVAKGDPAEIARLEKTKYRPGFISEFEEPIEPLIAPLIRAISNCPAIHRGAKTAE